MRASTLAIAATLALSLGAQAQGTFPEKPVRIIVDSAPGSATDVSVRLMAERLSAIWGQQAVVDNRPGGGGESLHAPARQQHPTAIRSMLARLRRSSHSRAHLAWRQTYR